MSSPRSPGSSSRPAVRARQAGGCCPDPLCKPGLIAYGDYLYWRASPTGLGFATIVNPVTLNPQTPSAIATANLDLPQAGGYRLGAGYRFPGTSCDLTWNYTHFESSDQQTVVADGANTELLSTRSFFSTVPMTSIEADDTLKLNIQDIEVNWRSWLNDYVGFRGFGGVRFATLDENFNNNYTLLTSVSGTINLPTRMTAAGIRLGAECQWRTAWGFRVFGRAAPSLLVADFRPAQRVRHAPRPGDRRHREHHAGCAGHRGRRGNRLGLGTGGTQRRL